MKLIFLLIHIFPNAFSLYFDACFHCVEIEDQNVVYLCAEYRQRELPCPSCPIYWNWLYTDIADYPRRPHFKSLFGLFLCVKELHHRLSLNDFRIKIQLLMCLKQIT